MTPGPGSSNLNVWLALAPVSTNWTTESFQMTYVGDFDSWIQTTRLWDVVERYGFLKATP